MTQCIEEVLAEVDDKVTQYIQTSVGQVPRPLWLKSQGSFSGDMRAELRRRYENLNQKSPAFLNSLWHYVVALRSEWNRPECLLFTSPMIPDTVFGADAVVSGRLPPTEIEKERLGHKFVLAENAVQARLSRYYAENAWTHVCSANIVQLRNDN
jgi:hypothetical protein